LKESDSQEVKKGGNARKICSNRRFGKPFKKSFDRQNPFDFRRVVNSGQRIVWYIKSFPKARTYEKINLGAKKSLLRKKLLHHSKGKKI
jgi:hypothetical protein